MTEVGDDRMQCALCGGRFDHGGVVCGGCPLASGCDIVKCPHCGYQFPRASRLVEWWRRLFGRPAAPEGHPEGCPSVPALTLDTLEVGQGAVVDSVGFDDPLLAVRLAHLGLVPGAKVRLRQRRPAAVVQLGETTLALQRSIARRVAVREEGS